MRCVVEGESPDEGNDSDEEDEEEEAEDTWHAKPGVVYRLIKGQLKLLAGGMRKYEAIAERASGKLAVLN